MDLTLLFTLETKISSATGEVEKNGLGNSNGRELLSILLLTTLTGMLIAKLQASSKPTTTLNF